MPPLEQINGKDPRGMIFFKPLLWLAEEKFI